MSVAQLFCTPLCRVTKIVIEIVKQVIYLYLIDINLGACLI